MSQGLLTLLAIIPIIWLVLSLGVFKMRGDLACFIALIITLILSMIGFHFSATESLSAALEGIVMAFWPIIYVIIAAVFTYNVSSESGGMNTIKEMLISITSDMRILVLLLAWGFGGFLEAIAGFGTAVAIPASILAVLGMSPVKAAIICLIANTTPTAFGAIGLPVTTLAQVTGLDVKQLSFVVTLQLSILIVLIPFCLVTLTGGSFRSIKGVFWITLASGLAFSVPEIFVSKYLGAELPSIAGSLICIVTIIVLVKWIGPKEEQPTNSPKVTAKEGLIAWLPFILVFAFIMLTSSLVPAIHNRLGSIQSSFTIFQGAHAKPYVISWVTSPGTLIILATILGGLFQGITLTKSFSILWHTTKQMTKTMVTVASIVALSKIMGYSGMVNTIALSLVLVTGSFYPFISPIIGALGTFITGSDTSANVLFGELQVKAAHTLDVSPYWLAGANMAGATAGKMISPQSIAVATGATGLVGEEGTILKQAMKFCAIYTLIICFVIFVLGKLFGQI